MATDLARRDPFRSLLSFPRWIEDMDFATASQRGLRVRETEKDIIVESVVAGVPAKNVDVDIEDGVLTIRAEQTEEKEDQTSSYSYYYTLALSGGQWDKAAAEVEDGVVYVTIPKTEAARPQKIKVKAKKK